MKLKLPVFFFIAALGSSTQAEPPKQTGVTPKVITPDLNIEAVKKIPPAAGTKGLPNVIQAPANTGSKGGSAPRISEAAGKIVTQPKIVAPALQNVPPNSKEPPSQGTLPGGVTGRALPSAAGATTNTIIKVPRLNESGANGAAANANLPQGQQGPQISTPNGINGNKAAEFEGLDIAKRMRGVDIQGGIGGSNPLGPGLGGKDTPGNPTPGGAGSFPPRQGAEFDAQLEGITGLTGKSNTDRMSETSKGFRAGVVSDPATQMSNARGGRAGSVDSKSIDSNGDGTTTVSTKQVGDDRSVTVREITTSDSGGYVTRVREITTYSNGSQDSTTSTRTARGDYHHEGIIMESNGRTRTSDSTSRRPWTFSVDPDSPQGGSGEALPLHRKKDTPMEAATKKMKSTVLPPGPDSTTGGGAPRLNVDVDLTGQPNPDGTAGGGGTNFMNKPKTGREVNPPKPTTVR